MRGPVEGEAADEYRASLPNGDDPHVPGGSWQTGSARSEDARRRKTWQGPGPSGLECLLYAGHTGLSTDVDPIIYGFNPDTGTLAAWQAMQSLRQGNAFPGVVRDDTGVFSSALSHGLRVLTFKVLLPESGFLVFEGLLSDERKHSRYSYGFPDGDGDCNCTTWLERLTLPLLTGSMDEFTNLPGFVLYPTRRFGRCN